MKDGPGYWLIPETVADFNAAELAVPDFLWGLQESSGSLLNSIGASIALDPTNGTGQGYRVSVPGWKRKFVTTDGVTAQQGWSTTSNLLDLGNGESAAIVCLAYGTSLAAATAQIAFFGSGRFVGLSAGTGKMRSGNGTNVSGSAQHSGNGMHLFCTYRNGTTNVSGGVSEIESFTFTHNETALSGHVKGIGGSAAFNAPPGGYGWLAHFKGANAERDWSAYIARMLGRA